MQRAAMVCLECREPTVTAVCTKKVHRKVEATASGRQGTERSLCSCYVGFVWGTGEPQKWLKKGRDMIKSGFICECLLP